MSRGILRRTGLPCGTTDPYQGGHLRENDVSRAVNSQSATPREGPMRVGVPKEIKVHEYRVSPTRGAGAELTACGRAVGVETGAGAGIDFTDQDYLAAGATIARGAKAVFDNADMIVKVKEPQIHECAWLKPGQTLFTYLHLAADKPQAEALMRSGATCIAYETGTDAYGGLPLLRPMSEVPGRVTARVGCYWAGCRASSRPRWRSWAAAFRGCTLRKWRSACAPT